MRRGKHQFGSVAGFSGGLGHAADRRRNALGGGRRLMRIPGDFPGRHALLLTAEATVGESRRRKRPLSMIFFLNQKGDGRV